MGKTIFNLFKNYYAQLAKLEEIKADRNDLIAIEEAAVRSMFTNKVHRDGGGDTQREMTGLLIRCYVMWFLMT